MGSNTWSSEPPAPPPPPLTLELPAPNQPAEGPGGRDWSLALPSTGGLLSLDAPDDRPIQLLVAADVRAAARKRLLIHHDPAERPSTGARMDLRAITSRVRVWPVGSQLEAELLFLRIAEAERPELAHAATDHASAWFLHIDPDEPFPKWRKRSTNELAAQSSTPAAQGGTLLGPIRDKHACQRAADELNDLFDLCRYHHILLQSPGAQPCAYKELGKCPAPCDGSETLDAYRARVREAIAFWRDPQQWQLHTEHAMAQAAARLDFEAAARCKERLDSARRLQAGPFAHARSHWEPGWIVLAAGVAHHTIRAIQVNLHGVTLLAEQATTEDPAAACHAIHAALQSPEQNPAHSRPNRPDATAWHTIGLLAHRLYTTARSSHPSPADPPDDITTPDSTPENSPAPTTTSTTAPTTTPPHHKPGTGCWSFAAIVPAMPRPPQHGFTCPSKPDTVSVPPVAGVPDQVDQSGEALVQAWRRAVRALARSRPKPARSAGNPPTQPHASQPPAIQPPATRPPPTHPADPQGPAA